MHRIAWSLLLVACAAPPPRAGERAMPAKSGPAPVPRAGQPSLTAPSPAPPPPSAAVELEWFPIVSAEAAELQVSAFEGGAVIASGSLLAIVEASRVTQDPRRLRGLPEWLNWDASVYVSGTPDRLELSAHAGNRHGPDFAALWTRGGWSTVRPKPDPRRAKLPRASAWVDEAELSFASGELLVVRYESEVEAFLISPSSQKPTRTVVPLGQPGIRHLLLGTKPNDVTLCESTVDAYHFDGKAWSEVDTEGRKPESCAVTSDGALFMLVEPAELWRRKASTWSRAPLPEGVQPARLAAAGDRLWLSGTSSNPQRSQLYSTKPVDAPLDIEEAELPGPVFVNGITGFDVTTVDVVSVSASPAGPGTRACSSLVAWLGPRLTQELEAAIGRPRPRLVEVAGVQPGQVVPAGTGAQMRVQSSNQERPGVAALPASYEEGHSLVLRVRRALPDSGARLVCAEPRVVRAFN